MHGLKYSSKNKAVILFSLDNDSIVPDLKFILESLLNTKKVKSKLNA
jgi:hypothetical protein